MVLTRLKLSCQKCSTPQWRLQKRICVLTFSSFKRLPACLPSGFPFLHLRNQQRSPLHISDSACPVFFHIERPCDYSHGNSFHVNTLNLITSAESYFTCKVTGSQGLKIWWATALPSTEGFPHTVTQRQVLLMVSR